MKKVCVLAKKDKHKLTASGVCTKAITEILDNKDGRVHQKKIAQIKIS